MVSTAKSNYDARKLEKKGFSFITEYRGDGVTPITLYNGLKGRRKFILESGSREEHFGRYSFLGEAPCKEVLGETLEEIEEIKNEVKVDFNIEGNPFPFKGGAIGYMGYDTITLYEKKLKFKNKDELNIPTIRFNFYKKYLCYDHFNHKVYVVENIFNEDNRDYDTIVKQQKEYFKEIISTQLIDEEETSKDEVIIRLGTAKEEYMEIVKRAQEYIIAGDIFQVVPSQRMYCKTNKTPFEIYRRLREENPSPYMFFLDYDEYQVIGSSPESLVSVRGREVMTNPIAGTRKRGKTIEEDNELEKELLLDEKERAEHVMLVDLGRNDIGRVSEIGTVEVRDFMKIERFSHVMHITSQVIGELARDKDAFDALASCLPAGTLSGAPKIRAMEIIEELEETRRGIYAGAVGYFSYGGDMDMCIAIRTLVLKEGVAYLQSGGGVVYDSDPALEFEETQHKLMILKEALR